MRGQADVGPPVLVAPGRPAAEPAQPWVIRLYEAADEVLWAAKLNALWWLFTAAGLGVLGIGPATVAAYDLARRHAMNETFRVVPAFLAVYRRNLLRGTALLLPPVGASAFLATNYFWFTAMGEAAAVLALVTLAALAATAVVTAYLLPMAVHYDVRTAACFSKASLFALTRPAASVLLLFVMTAAAYACVAFPLLLPAVAVGGWIQLNTWLCLRLFAENEARLRAERNR